MLTRDPSWQLPDSPHSELYDEALAKIEEGDIALYSELGLHDFYFFVRHILTLGKVLCKDPHHPFLYGKPWFDHPWLFKRCREIQAEPDGFLDLWPRYHFKTALITQSYPLWELAADSSLTFAIITYKKELAGESMIIQPKNEMQDNHLLPMLYPESFWRDPERQSPLWKADALCLPRALNPKEPTFCVLSVGAGGTSYHVDRRLWDDLVTEKAVENRQAIDKVTNSWKSFTGIAADDTRDRACGTHWAVNDTYRYILDLGAWKLRYHDLYEDDGVTPVLRSKEWCDDWKLKMGSFNFAAQMRNRPASAQVQGFKLEWWNTFDEVTEDRAKGCNIYIFVDTARVDKPNSDYSAIAVVGLMRGVPLGTFNVLDLYRDRMGLVQTTDLLFQLVDKWNPLGVFVEQVGAARDVEHFKQEMSLRKTSFRLWDVSERLPKEERIRRLQRSFEAGRFYFPRYIFGMSDGKKVDMVEMFRREEFLEWTPESGSTHDDLLDVLAWCVSPKLKDRLKFPSRIPERFLVNDTYRGGKDRHAKKESAWAC